MLKLLLILLAIDNLVLMCKWVCNHDNNDLKKYFFDQNKIVLEIPHLQLDITEPLKRDVTMRGESFFILLFAVVIK